MMLGDTNVNPCNKGEKLISPRSLKKMSIAHPNSWVRACRSLDEGALHFVAISFAEEAVRLKMPAALTKMEAVFQGH